MSFSKREAGEKHWIGLNYDTHYNLLRKRDRSDDARIYIRTYIHACASHSTHTHTHTHTHLLPHSRIRSFTQQAPVLRIYASTRHRNELEFLFFFFPPLFFTWIVKTKICFARKKEEISDRFRSKRLFLFELTAKWNESSQVNDRWERILLINCWKPIGIYFKGRGLLLCTLPR